MPRQTPSPPSQPRPLDPKIWRACAGASVKIPTLDSRVYYFPQGHLDQATSPPQNLSPRVLAKPCVLSRVVSRQFLADLLTDEVFVKLVLHPLIDHDSVDDDATPSDVVAAAPTQNDDDKIVSFAKVLTPSDANNGGGFSVPRFCADAIFPPLNFNADPPVQNIRVVDVHGSVWMFRHIYRGTPRRHLLTTGWSKFVNAKKLVAGDSVIFMKNSAGQLFVGIRRAIRPSGMCLMNSMAEEENVQAEEQVNEVFSRDGKGKLSPTVVAEAAESAVQNMPFEVIYYPKAGWSDFVVKTEAVDEAMKVRWGPGLRVKMAVETDDTSRMTWFQGTVSSVNVSENGPWPGSPWRMLQITWDEPEVLQTTKWVSPWEVELVSTTPALHSAFHPTRKIRANNGSGMFINGEGDPFSMTGFTNSAMGNLNRPSLSYGTSPAGMQGARHDVLYSSYFSKYPSDTSLLCMGNSFGNNTAPRLKTLSTDLNVRSPQCADELSADGRNSLHSYGTKPGSVVFQLFGSIIQTERPVENGLHGTGCTGDDHCRLFGAVVQTEQPVENGLHANGCTGGDQCQHVGNGNGVHGTNTPGDDECQCQRPSTVKTCYLMK